MTQEQIQRIALLACTKSSSISLYAITSSNDFDAIVDAIIEQLAFTSEGQSYFNHPLFRESFSFLVHHTRIEINENN